jgi:XFP C-terminal domain
MDAAIHHCTAGIGIWKWASNDEGAEPDVVMACAGDVPTLETLAAVDLIRRLLPGCRDDRQRGPVFQGWNDRDDASEVTHIGANLSGGTTVFELSLVRPSRTTARTNRVTTT